MELNRLLEHTLLRPEASGADIIRLCVEAKRFNLYSVVVNPCRVKLAAQELAGTGIQVCSVVGFPLGAGHSETKIAEAVAAESDGATEIDAVANIGWLCEGRFEQAEDEIRRLRAALKRKTILKIIIETPLLPAGSWAEAVAAVIAGGADYVKSATGFFGVTPPDHIQRLKAIGGERIRIKAAGGIKTAAQAMAMIQAGAARLGSSSSVAIMTGPRP